VLSGYKGLLVVVDEASVLSNHQLKPARDCNWNWVLNVYNLMHRGETPHFGLMLVGTEDLIHKDRGLFSNHSLKSCLFPGVNGEVTGPIITVQRFTAEELFVLLRRVRDLVFPLEEKSRFPDEAIEALLADMMEYRDKSFPLRGSRTKSVPFPQAKTDCFPTV
jgi:hypothetical protein